MVVAVPECVVSCVNGLNCARFCAPAAVLLCLLRAGVAGLCLCCGGWRVWGLLFVGRWWVFVVGVGWFWCWWGTSVRGGGFGVLLYFRARRDCCVPWVARSCVCCARPFCCARPLFLVARAAVVPCAWWVVGVRGGGAVGPGGGACGGCCHWQLNARARALCHTLHTQTLAHATHAALCRTTWWLL